jgi:hypothetical protein
MAIGAHHVPMDPIAFFIARDLQRRALEGSGPARRTTRRRPRR